VILGTWLPSFETIKGAKGNKDKYLSRMVWGRLRIHCFHRGDNDPDCHDHQWDFWTFPLSRHGYYEEVMMKLPKGTYYKRNNRVNGWSWTAVKAEHRHRVLWPAKTFYMHQESDRYISDRRKAGVKSDKWPIWTIVWTGPIRRPKWGFWILGEDRMNPRFIDWKTYIFGDKHAVDAPSTVD
jgi:hypothetical protein